MSTSAPKHDLTLQEQRRERWRRRTLKLLRVLEVLFWLVLGVVVVSVLTVGGAIYWLSRTHQQSTPLNLDPWLPRIEALTAAQGVALQVGHLETYFDKGVVLRAEGLEFVGPVAGGGNEPGLVVEELAIKLSGRRLFAFEVAPKTIEARGVTARLILHDKEIRIAGLVDANVDKLPDDSMLDWLNNLSRDANWGALKRINVGRVTLLFQDDDHKAGWVLEDGQAKMRRNDADGEHAEVNANLRRLYGQDAQTTAALPVAKPLAMATPSSSITGLTPAALGAAPMPVILKFDHLHRSDKATIGLVFAHADLSVVASYLPPQLANLLRGSGQVGLETTLDRHNKVEDPGVNLQLQNVTITPPSAYSHALQFSQLNLLATYQPSPTDMLQVRRLDGVFGTDTPFKVRGDVRDLGTDPLINLQIDSSGGEATRIVDLLPDLQIKDAVKWLTTNLHGGRYANLHGRYTGRPSAMPNCGDLCGISVDTQLQGLHLSFLKDLPDAVNVSGTVSMRGKTITINVPAAQIGKQQVSQALVRVTDLFQPTDARLLANANLHGDAGELARSLMKLAKTDLPGRLNGDQSTTLALNIPLPKGRDAQVEEMGILATTRLTKATLDQAPDLPGIYKTDSTTIVVAADRNVRIYSDGTLLAAELGDSGQAGAQVEISDTLDHFGQRLGINARGVVPGKWLAKTLRISDQVSLTGPTGMAGNVQRLPDGWQFVVDADGGKAALAWPAVKWTKPAGTPLRVQTQGAYHDQPAARVTLSSIKVTGGTAASPLNVAGNMDLWPTQLPKSSIMLQPLVFGRDDLTVNFKDQNLTLNGKQLDVSAFDLLGTEKKSVPQAPGGLLMKNNSAKTDEFDHLHVSMNVQKVIAKQGTLNNVVADVRQTHGHWDVNSLQAQVEKGGKIVLSQQGGGAGSNLAGVRKLLIQIDNTGQVMAALGIYDALQGGNLKGQINYDTNGNATGQLTMMDYQLRNPPLLAKLLGLLSLQQLLAGTDTILFKSANVPLRIEGDVVWLDNAEMVGPTMSLQLDGSLDRGAGQLNMDGRVSPAIPFNRLVAQIPLLGTLLTGSQDGLVTADFKLKGSIDNPAINVHPLSLITPGLVKDAWHALTAPAPKDKKAQ